MAENILSVDNLCVQFDTREGSNHAVKNASFNLEKGKILGIVGESGSGKSVTCYSLMGLIPSPPGKISQGSAQFVDYEADDKNDQIVDLIRIGEKKLRNFRGNKISMIFQDPMTSLNPYMPIGKQLTEALHAHFSLDKNTACERAIKTLEEVGIRQARERFNSYPHEYSGGMRQRVMIAMALITEPELLIADEPTTALDVTVQQQILNLLKDIQKKRHLSIIFITHDLGVIAHLADHIIVMEKGHIVEQGSPRDIFLHNTHPYTKKLIGAIPSSAKPFKNEKLNKANTLIEIKNLSTRFLTHSSGIFNKQQEYLHAVKNISLEIKRGEIFGLVGESGSGKSTLGRSIIRLVESFEGEVIFNGENIYAYDKQQLRRQRRHFQMIFQDPYASLNPRMTVFDTLAEPMRANKLVEENNIAQAVNELMDDVGLERRYIRKYPHEFSGGQRQRIAIGRALAAKPQFIVADEPVSALDVTIQAQVLDLMLELTQKHNLTMLFISHDLSVVRYICDKVAVMQQGEIVEMNETETLFNQPEQQYTQNLLAAIPKISLK